MYGVILMAALTTNGPDAVACHGRWHGCGGCYGCGGCWGGCHGCGGCWGGCYGCGGCWGGCYGGWGHGHGCHCWGGTACYGGCYGSCLGCYGHYHSCYGGCYGQPIWYGGGNAMPYHDSGNPMAVPAKPGEAVPAPKTPEAKPMGAAAKLIIDVPEGSQLFVDDRPMKAGSGARQFVTPELAQGQTYYYTLRVEGTKSETRRVIVRAGELVRETFADAKTDTLVKAGK